MSMGGVKVRKRENLPGWTGDVSIRFRQALCYVEASCLAFW